MDSTVVLSELGAIFTLKKDWDSTIKDDSASLFEHVLSFVKCISP